MAFCFESSSRGRPAQSNPLAVVVCPATSRRSADPPTCGSRRWPSIALAAVVLLLAASDGTAAQHQLYAADRASADQHLNLGAADSERLAVREAIRVASDLPSEGRFTVIPYTALQARRAPDERPLIVRVMLYALYFIIFLICVYIVRHYFFTLNRLFRRPRQPYVDVDTAEWPAVTVLVPAHNEEPVIDDILQALLEADYPHDRLTLTPINDRSTDKTREKIEAYAREYPVIVKPYTRRDGMPGKAAALNDAMEAVETEIVLVFDADYVPGHGLIKQLVAPFFDPEVGAVMGRVVPHNVESNLLTRLLDLERAGGYQVDQQARMNLHLVPQYGGTVGGVRKGALESVGGWCEDALAEDTDATYRLLLGGWKTVYQNRSECYEQVPETWDSRLRQIRRWAVGHNQAAARYGMRLLRSGRAKFFEKLDGWLLLGVYTMSPVLVVGWALGIVLWYLGAIKPGLIVILLVVSYSTLGNFATFFEVASAAHLDGSLGRIQLLPFIFLGFLVSLFAVTRATLSQVVPQRRGEEVLWHKTERNHNHNHNYQFNNHNNHNPQPERGGDDEGRLGDET